MAELPFYRRPSPSPVDRPFQYRIDIENDRVILEFIQTSGRKHGVRLRLSLDEIMALIVGLNRAAIQIEGPL